jgi:5-methylcytosine-specific restriction endonuclease McrA
MGRRRPCLEPGCPETTTRSRCPAHESQHRAAKEARLRAADPRRAIYQSREWAQARAQARRRAQYRCEHVEDGQRCPRIHGHGQRLEVHHVIPVFDGGDPFDLANLVVLCHDHHLLLERDYRSTLAGAAGGLRLATGELGRPLAVAEELIRG